MRHLASAVFICLSLGACARGPLGAELVAGGFDSPIFLTAAPGDGARLFVLEQVSARVLIVRGGEVSATPFLDINAKVSNDGGERGLFSLAFHPDYAANGLFFVCYSDNGGATVIERYRVSANADAADPASGLIILAVAQPFANHNGGMIAFSPVDGFLYAGLGDGGSANDPEGNGQDRAALLGKMLRIDVDGAAPYAIPASNPFADGVGGAPEIWAYGLRNPWRFSFDRETGDLYIGDVGQGAREEIDFQPFDSPGGENYGWNIAEGFACPGGEGACGTNAGFTPPIHDYSQGIARSVTGGYVYRGSAMPAEVGNYFFADYVSGKVWSFRRDGTGVADLRDRTADFGGIEGIASFGEDADGELYVLSLSSGEVFRLVPSLAAE